MRPIHDITSDEARRLSGVLFDLDDTLLDEGILTLPAYAALWSLRDNGMHAVGVTGRPSAWADLLARQWPVDGVIAENGAVSHHREGVRVVVTDSCSVADRKRRRARLAEIAAEVARRCPELEPTGDVDGRVSDYTFDIGERRSVPGERVAEIAEIAEALGARTVRSTVHLHLTLDGDDKASGAVRFIGTHFGLDATAGRSRFAFIGDSQNDEACFSGFETTIAVKNLSGRPTVAPRYVTSAERGAGFAEAVRTLISHRSSG